MGKFSLDFYIEYCVGRSCLRCFWSETNRAAGSHERKNELCFWQRERMIWLMDNVKSLSNLE